MSKLTEAREQVAVMQKKAAKKSKLLAEKQAAADEALKDISKSMTVRTLLRIFSNRSLLGNNFQLKLKRQF